MRSETLPVPPDSSSPPAEFERFYESSRVLLWRAIAAKYGVRFADDAVSDAMLQALQRWNYVSRTKNPRGYVYRIAERAAAKASRSVGRSVGLLVEDVQDEILADVDLQRELLSLSPRQRAAVLLVHGWRYSYRDAAETLSISEGTLRNHLDRGMAKLRRSLGQEDSTP